MKSCRLIAGVMCGLAVVACLGVSAAAYGADTSFPEWPHRMSLGGFTYTIYQPQLESWDYVTLKAVCAVSVQPEGSEEQTFGTMDIQVKTDVDRAARVVSFEDFEIPHAEFPSAGGQADTFIAALGSLLPERIDGESLDRLEAALAITEARRTGTGQPLRNDPPEILFSTRPAIVVLVDGSPVYRPVEGTELVRVFNTRALILRDAKGKHYLHLFDGYVEAAGLEGPWTIAAKVPGDVKKAERQAVEAKQVDLLAGQEDPETEKMPTLAAATLPVVYVSSVPTELVVIEGEPNWTPIPTTGLLCVENTSAHVFKDIADQKTYLLISGRWFRSPSFGGPWEFVPGENLPEDFAQIPDDSPQENVKASVPGTRQAQEAAIANDVPNTVKVDRAKTEMEPPPQYDGAPQLEPIEGTTLSYVVNSPAPVVKVDANTWFACQDGVWFAAKAASGPWVVATSVPAVIYSIPPSSPVYYVVYSRVYRYDAAYVWVGTTPGYYGTVVSSDGIVVYGTGYPYVAYVGPTIYVSYPVTYGYGCNPCWTPWAGWAFGFAVGWAMAADWYWWYGCPPAPYWGPYWHHCYGAYYNPYGGITAWGPYGWAGTSGYIYQHEGPWTSVSRASAGYNAWTGNRWATQYGRAYNSTTGTRVIGQRGAVDNVYTGNYAYGGRGAFYNEETGIAGAGRKVTWGNEQTGKEGTAGGGTVYNPKTGEATHIAGIKTDEGGVIKVNDQVIAGKDGNYYRPDGEGGWEQITRPPTGTTGATGSSARAAQGGQEKWQKVEPSSGNQQLIKSLDAQQGARQAGAQRERSFQANRPAQRGSGSRRR